jgi:hypothetical protein
MGGKDAAPTRLPSGCWDRPELPKHGENIHVVMNFLGLIATECDPQ